MLEAETSGGAHCFIGLYSLNPTKKKKSRSLLPFTHRSSCKKKKELQALTCTVEMDTAGKGLSMSKKKKKKEEKEKRESYYLILLLMEKKKKK